MEESDLVILPMKLANNEAKASAELVEGRTRTKGKMQQPSTLRTQSRKPCVP